MIKVSEGPFKLRPSPSELHEYAGDLQQYLNWGSAQLEAERRLGRKFWQQRNGRLE
jgi:hypothetical protein